MYFRLINKTTGKALKLSYNSQSIEDIRESILIYISLDKDISNMELADTDSLLDEAKLIIEQSETMFDELPVAFSEHYISVQTKERYVPQGRIKHISNYQ